MQNLIAKKNRNKYCYSCANATERCFKNEICCPCEKYKSYKEELVELRKVAEFQQASNMSRHFENKKLKEGLAVGSILNKELNSLNKTLEEERDKYRNMVFDKNDQLTKAKTYLKYFIEILKKLGVDKEPLVIEAEQFLNSEVEK